MRRLFALIAVLAAIPAVVAVAGCGADDLEPVSVAEAAEGTRAAETAHLEMSVVVKGAGLPLEVEIPAEGVTATNAADLDMTADLGQLLAFAGAGGGDGKTRVIVDGSEFYVDPPELPGLEVPGGASWVTADAAAVLRAVGLDPDGLGELLRLTPTQQIAALEAAGDIEKVGEEEIDGVQTSHLRGTITMDDYIDTLPRDHQEATRKALRELDRASGTASTLDDPMPTDVWIDADKRIRKMVQSAEFPASAGMPAGEANVTTELSDFGTDLEIEAPDEDDVFDATDVIVGALG